jgi:VanZ family protein
VTRALFLWGPVVLVMALIFAGSSIPHLERLPGDISDHTGHFLAYAGLAAVCVRALAGARWAGVNGGRAAVAWLMSIVYGISDELHQRFVPGRTATVDDLMADGFGAAAACVVLVLSAQLIVRRRGERAV